MNENMQTNQVRMTNISFDFERYDLKTPLSVTVTLLNREKKASPLYLKLSLLGPMKRVIELPVKKVNVPAHTGAQRFALVFSLKNLGIRSVVSGFYTAVATLWNAPPTQ